MNYIGGFGPEVENWEALYQSHKSKEVAARFGGTGKVDSKGVGLGHYTKVGQKWKAPYSGYQ